MTPPCHSVTLRKLFAVAAPALVLLGVVLAPAAALTRWIAR